MIPFVVVPMLNEITGIEATCRSLGFAEERSTDRAILVLVDNGSSDGTAEVAERIRRSCGGDRVIVVHESCRGHVSARAAGIQAVSARAETLKLPLERALVLQADADTVYDPGYVDAMVGAAEAEGRGVLLEGASIPPTPDVDPCRPFRELEAWVDDGLIAAPEELDVVVDDKVAGYLLSDYDRWGGHTREFDEATHEEILAETTRLFVRAKIRCGARRFRVDGAMATTSSRRILEDPALAFATAGFPRGRHWKERWRSTYVGPSRLEAFTVANRAALAASIATRRRHLAAIFELLPVLVARDMELEPRSPFREDEGSKESRRSSGRMLSEVFERAGIG